MRGLAHRAHWNRPTGRLFERFGAVPASPRAAYKMLKQGESVLLFPGGGREVQPLTCTLFISLLSVILYIVRLSASSWHSTVAFIV